MTEIFISRLLWFPLSIGATLMGIFTIGSLMADPLGSGRVWAKILSGWAGWSGGWFSNLLWRLAVRLDPGWRYLAKSRGDYLKLEREAIRKLANVGGRSGDRSRRL